MFGKKTQKTYKGHDIILDPENNLWVIRKRGPYGTSVGTSPNLEEAKRYVDKLV